MALKTGLLQRIIARLLDVAVWGYLVLVLIFWQVLQRTGDAWWPGTVLLFSPRWFFAVPVSVLLLLVLLRRRWLLSAPLIAALLVVVFPFMGYNWPHGSGGATGGGKPLRVVTCNTHMGDFDQLKLSQLIRDTAADIVVLQEFSPKVVLAAPPGWGMIAEKGFAVLSRYSMEGLQIVSMPPPGETWQKPQMLQTVVKTPVGPVAVCSVHLPTPRFGLQELFDRKTLIRPSRKGGVIRNTRYRLEAARMVQQAVNKLAMPVIVAGDFNTPTESRLFQEVWGGYKNAFSETGSGYGYTQRVRFSGLRYSSRIDHILTSNELKPLTSAVGPDVGSDHLPLIADIGWAVAK